jgi:hypothetical protein
MTFCWIYVISIDSTSASYEDVTLIFYIEYKTILEEVI